MPISSDKPTIGPPSVDGRNVETKAAPETGLGFLVINNADSDYLAGQGEDNSYADAEPGSAVESGSMVGPKFKTPLPEGTYCNVLVPDCGEVVEVAKDGSFAAQIPSGHALALHVGARR